MRELHLFAGAGGGILGGRMLGHRCVGAVEIDPYCRSVLEARQRDGSLEPFPIHDDIRTFDGRAWRGRVDAVCGGFPCQDVSVAGKRRGLAGERSGLWWEMHRIIHEVAPRWVFVENVPGLLVRGFDAVLGSLADLGFDAEWCVLSAADVGAPHLRKRLWILAMANASSRRCGGEGEGEVQLEGGAEAVRSSDAGGAGEVADPESVGRREGRPQSEREQGRHDASECGVPLADSDEAPDTRRPMLEVGQGPAGERAQPTTGGRRRAGWWSAEPRVGRVDHGIPSRVDRLKALGNAQVPLVAATAWRILMDRFRSPAGA